MELNIRNFNCALLKVFGGDRLFLFWEVFKFFQMYVLIAALKINNNKKDHNIHSLSFVSRK